MKKILIIGTLLMSAGLSLAQEDPSMSAHDEKLMNWMRTNTSPVTGMPFSFEILGNKHDVLKRIGRRSSTTGIIERVIVDKGVSIYDAALWQMVLSSTGSVYDLKMALRPDEYYWNGELNEFINIRTGSSHQPFVYDPLHPDAVTSNPSIKGSRGFIFRILNADGKYLASDPLDGKSVFNDFPNDAHIHWEDWKPIAGENAWVVLAAGQLLKHIPKEDLETSTAFKLSRELARAALYLQAPNGGIRMAPLGSYFHLLNIPPDSSEEKITRLLDKRAKSLKLGFNVPRKDFKQIGGVDYPPYQTWYYDEISTENNLSWYAALRMMSKLKGDGHYLEAMERIEYYLRSVWDSKENSFYQGAHFTNDRWVPNKRSFAVDVQNWAIAVLGPGKIDQWFGEGAAYKIWSTTKRFSGVFDHDHLKGVGFTKEKDRISIEWTAGAILATRKLADYYAATHSDWSKEASDDAVSMRHGVDDYCFDIRPNEAAYSYSSVRRWIPFGWFSHDPEVLSLASTAWIVLIDQGIDPFEP